MLYCAFWTPSARSTQQFSSLAGNQKCVGLWNILKLQWRYPEPKFLRWGFENSLKNYLLGQFTLRVTLNRKCKESLCASSACAQPPHHCHSTPVVHPYDGWAYTDMWTLRQSQSFSRAPLWVSCRSFIVWCMSNSIVPYRIYRNPTALKPPVLCLLLPLIFLPSPPFLPFLGLIVGIM